MSDNTSNFQDEFQEFDDWIELYNPSDTDIEISGYWLSDDPENLKKYQFPVNEQLVVPAQGFLMVWADGDHTQGPLHTDFGLSKKGEFLSLVAPQGQMVDSVTFGPLDPNHSYGRNGDGGAHWVAFTTPTPQQSNALTVSNRNTESQLRERFKLFPNPVSEWLYFEETTSGQMLDLSGRELQAFEDQNKLSVAEFKDGLYLIRTDDGRTAKVLVFTPER